MKILISASMRHHDELVPVAETLRGLGYEVELPDNNNPSYSKKQHIDKHLGELTESDALLLGNVDGYIGASTFFEAGWAFALKKPIYVLEKFDKNSSFTEDLKAIGAIELCGDWDKLEKEK